MDFLDPKKKQAHQIRLFIGYGLMAVALTIATFIVVFATYGYDIDRRSGSIIQNGLISLDTQPESATVYVNGQQQGRTANRLVLPAGDYGIELRSDGYRTWRHDVSLEGSSIEQLVYPFLFPENMQARTLRTYSVSPTLAAHSPDRRWLVTETPGQFGSFNVTDLNDEANETTTITVPDNVLTSARGNHKFSLVEWSTDNTHLVIKHAYSKTSEFILIDRAQPNDSLNLTKSFDEVKFDTIRLRDKNPNRYYLLRTSSGELHSAELRTRQVTSLLKGVAEFQPYQDDTLLYVTKPEGKAKQAEVRLRQDKRDIALRSVMKADRYLLDLARFQDHFYVVAGAATEDRVYIYQDPLRDTNRPANQAPQPFRVLVADRPSFISFSNNARFIALQAGSTFAVYDAETGRQFRYDTGLKLAIDQRARWMDGHRLTVATEGQAYVFDFDGTNPQSLVPAAQGYDVYFNRDYDALYTLAPNNDKTAPTALTRTELRLP